MSEPRDSEFRGGWPILVMALVGVAAGSSPLPFFALGALTKPWASEFGWGRGQVSGFMTIFTFGAVMGAPFAGLLLDRFGVRRVGLTSLSALALGLAAVGVFTQGVVTFYGIGIVTAMIAAGSLPPTWSRAVMGAFHRRRGLALGLAMTGTGISAGILPLYTTWLVTQFDWRVAMIGVGGIPGLIAVPLGLLLLPKGVTGTTAPRADEPEGATLREAVGHYRFWMIGLGFLIISLGVGGVLMHLIPMLTDRGYTPVEAAAVASVQGLALIVGRAATGWLMDRFWAPGVAGVLLSLPAVACLVLATAIGGPAATTASAAIMGLAAGAEVDLLAFLIGRYFGMRHFGAIYGAIYAIYVVGAGSAPTIFGFAFDATGSYAFILKAAASCFLVGAAMLLTLGVYPSVVTAPTSAAE